MWIAKGRTPRTLRSILWTTEVSLEFHLAVLWRWALGIKRRTVSALGMSKSGEAGRLFLGTETSVLLFGYSRWISEWTHCKSIETVYPFPSSIYTTVSLKKRGVPLPLFPHCWTRRDCLWLFNLKGSSGFQSKRSFEGVEGQVSSFRGYAEVSPHLWRLSHLLPMYSATKFSSS